MKKGSASPDELSRGLEPIARFDAETLILGSLPSERSIQSGEYFAHPRNAFWRIMGKLVNAGPELGYPDRVKQVLLKRLAIWDVLAAAVRPGSLDAAIQQKTAQANDFTVFLREHSAIRRVCFNGQKAAGMFDRLIMPGIGNRAGEIHFVTLPSTSPAYAAMSFEQKLSKWSIIAG